MAVTPLNIADMAFSELGENVTVNVPSYSVSAGSVTGGAATLTIGAHTLLKGQTIYVSGISPTDWNGYFTITSVTGTTITFAAAYTDAYVSGGTVTWAFPYDGTPKASYFNALWYSAILLPVLIRHPWNGLKTRVALSQPTLTVTAGSYNSGNSTVTLTVGPHSLQIGQPIYVTGINPAGWNTSTTITGVTSTTISYVLATSGSYVSGGTVTWGAVFDYSYVYTLPADIIRAIQVNSIFVSPYFTWSAFIYVPTGNVMPPFKIENGTLLSNQSTVDLLYCQIQNPPQEGGLVDLLVARAAAELAFPATHDNNIKKEKLDDYNRKLREMITANSQQGVLDPFQETSWITARQ